MLHLGSRIGTFWSGRNKTYKGAFCGKMQWRGSFLKYDFMNVHLGVTNINFRYERIFKYIYIQKTIWTNIWIYLYQRNDTNEYPNIFVSKRWYERISEYIRIKKMLQSNIQIYSFKKNYTNIIRKYSNIRIYIYNKILLLGFRFYVRCCILCV